MQRHWIVLFLCFVAAAWDTQDAYQDAMNLWHPLSTMMRVPIVRVLDDGDDDDDDDVEHHYNWMRRRRYDHRA